MGYPNHFHEIEMSFAGIWERNGHNLKYFLFENMDKENFVKIYLNFIKFVCVWVSVWLSSAMRIKCTQFRWMKSFCRHRIQ